MANPDIFRFMDPSVMDQLPLKDLAADILETTPGALQAFEEAYAKAILPMNAPSVREMIADEACDLPPATDIEKRIVNELLGDTQWLSFDGGEIREGGFPKEGRPVDIQEVEAIPLDMRPQLTGRHMVRDLDPKNGLGYALVLFFYGMYLDARGKDPARAAMAYGHFRQGLDILDLDPVLYAMLDREKSTIGKWLAPLAEAARGSMFAIPKTRVVRVPMPILQMTRMEGVNAVTRRIVDRWAEKAFDLDPAGDYFVKTGLSSSKFDFRNARVTTPKEVSELGEYLLHIHREAVMMAGPLNNPAIYGRGTTNEWVVREFIPDSGGNPTIYQGLPLRTEYRFFADMETGEIIGESPYWEPKLMKDRFSKHNDAGSPHTKHDYVIFKSHEKTLMRRYEENVARIRAELAKVVGKMRDLGGQWSIDVMQDGDDFWLIDMATAATSALVSCVRPGLVRHEEIDWLPRFAIPAPEDRDAAPKL